MAIISDPEHQEGAEYCSRGILMEKEVFISYKAEEFDEASWVRQVLESHNISCWMAPSCIPGGSSYASEIPKAIKGCKVFVLILSSRSQASKWVSREVDLAINYGKTVMPFMLENCDLKDDFNFYLTNVQRYAAYENKLQAAEKMLKEIQAVIGVQAHFDIGNIPPIETPVNRGNGNGTTNMGNGGTNMGNGGTNMGNGGTNMGNGGVGMGGRTVGQGGNVRGTGVGQGGQRVGQGGQRPAPTNFGVLQLTPHSSGKPIYLTREAARTKFGASGLVGLIFAVLTLVLFIVVNGFAASEVSSGYATRDDVAAVLSLVTFIPAFVSFVVCCRGIRGGKAFSLVSRIMGGIGLAISVVLLVIPIFMGLSAVKGDFERPLDYDLTLDVAGVRFDVDVDGEDATVVYKTEYVINEYTSCYVNVEFDGDSSKIGDELTVYCPNSDDYCTIWFDHSYDSAVTDFIAEMKNDVLLSMTLTPSQMNDLELLCAFSRVTIYSDSPLYQILDELLIINSIKIDVEDDPRMTSLYYSEGRFDFQYHYNGEVSVIESFDEGGIRDFREEYDEYGNLTATYEYDSYGNLIQ